MFLLEKCSPSLFLDCWCLRQGRWSVNTAPISLRKL